MSLKVARSYRLVVRRLYHHLPHGRFAVGRDGLGLEVWRVNLDGFRVADHTPGSRPPSNLPDWLARRRSKLPFARVADSRNCRHCEEEQERAIITIMALVSLSSDLGSRKLTPRPIALRGGFVPSRRHLNRDAAFQPGPILKANRGRFPRAGQVRRTMTMPVRAELSICALAEAGHSACLFADLSRARVTREPPVDWVTSKLT